jgi:hypothetical protein
VRRRVAYWSPRPEGLPRLQDNGFSKELGCVSGLAVAMTVQTHIIPIVAERVRSGEYNKRRYNTLGYHCVLARTRSDGSYSTRSLTEYRGHRAVSTSMEDSMDHGVESYRLRHL